MALAFRTMLKYNAFFSTTAPLMTKTNFDARAIIDPKQIELLASPVRQEVVDTLAMLGGRATVAELSDQLGRHADGLYYHLRRLVLGGLLLEEPASGATERVYVLAGDYSGPLRLRYCRNKPNNLSAVLRYVGGLLKVTASDFKAALAMPGVKLNGNRRQLWAARSKGWVNATDLEEINALLERLCELTSQTRRPDRSMLISLAFVFSPVAQKERRRGGI